MDPEDIESLASQLRRDCGVVTPPISIQALCDARGIALRRHRFAQEFDGMLYRRGDDLQIIVNSAHPVARQRFTGAHELFHVDHGGQAVTLFSLSFFDDDVDEDEWNANAFASALLMPAALLFDDVRGGMRPAAAQVKYHVSASALRWRLRALGFQGATRLDQRPICAQCLCAPTCGDAQLESMTAQEYAGS